MATEEEGFESQPDQTLDQRVGALETGQQGLADKLDNVLGILGKGEHAAQRKAEQHEEDKLDRPTSVAEQIRAQLEERDRKAAADRAAADRDSELASLKKRVEEMGEKPPEPPVRKVEKIMGWR